MPSKLVLFFGFLISIPFLIQAKSQVHFSPAGGCEAETVRLISESVHQIDVAVYSINNLVIVNALNQAIDRGVKIKILTDHTQASVNSKTTLALSNRGFDLRLHSVGRIMHNKFGVFDKKKVITGSFNWTNPAEAVNEENCVTLDEPSVVEGFDRRFSEHLWPLNTAEKSQKHLAHLRERITKKSAERKEAEKL